MLSPQSKDNPHSLTTSILVINFIVVCCCRSQHWRQKFVDLALIWMEVFAKQISKWVVTAVAQDQVSQFEIVHVHNWDSVSNISLLCICMY